MVKSTLISLPVAYQVTSAEYILGNAPAVWTVTQQIHFGFALTPPPLAQL
jgi:hypothetical protein